MSKTLFTTIAVLTFSASAAPAQQSNNAQSVLNVAITGMRDGAGVGEMLMDYLEAKRVGFEIRPTQKQVSDIEGAGDRRNITFSPAIASASPRYVTLHLAEKAAQIKLEHMPASAEKEFMILSLTVRSWLELGGDRTKLPLFDKTRDDSMAEKVKAWISMNMGSYVREAKAKDLPTLESVLAQKESEFKAAVCESDEHGLLSEIEKLKKDQADAAAFAQEESNWLLARRGTYP